MKFSKWLKQLDTLGLYCNVYIDNDEDPIYCGLMRDIPFWIADLPLVKYTSKEDKAPPIWFASRIRKSAETLALSNKGGFIITITEEEDNE